MKIQVVKKAANRADNPICPYFVDVPLPDQKKS
jgi:hypothetical protein